MKRFLWAVFALMLAAGCASRVQYDYPSAELIARGKEYMELKKYKKAAAEFDNAILNADNPDDAQEAQRLLGDAYYFNKQYLDAIAAYEVYYDIYYDSEAVPLVLYRLAMAYSRISLHPRADQTFTYRSVEFFDQLERAYPEEYEKLNAAVTHQAMREKLAEHEYQVGRFYLRINEPESAARRFLYMLHTYPGSKREEDALAMLIIASLATPGQYGAAVDYFDTLQERFPESRQIPSLKRRLDRARPASAAE